MVHKSLCLVFQVAQRRVAANPFVPIFLFNLLDFVVGVVKNSVVFSMLPRLQIFHDFPYIPIYFHIFLQTDPNRYNILTLSDMRSLDRNSPTNKPTTSLPMRSLKGDLMEADWI